MEAVYFKICNYSLFCLKEGNQTGFWQIKKGYMEKSLSEQIFKKPFCENLRFK